MTWRLYQNLVDFAFDNKKERNAQLKALYTKLRFGYTGPVPPGGLRTMPAAPPFPPPPSPPHTHTHTHTFFCSKKKKEKQYWKKQRVSKQNLLKGCHQSQNARASKIHKFFLLPNHSGEQYTFQCFMAPPLLKSTVCRALNVCKIE